MKEDELNHYRPLLVGLIDGELSPAEVIEVNEALGRSAQLREEYDALIDADQSLDSIRMLEPDDIIMQSLWKSPYHRMARFAGVGLLVGGYALISLYGILQYLASDSAPLPRIATAAMLLGSLMLLITYVTERFKTYKHDPYKEIER